MHREGGRVGGRERGREGGRLPSSSSIWLAWNCSWWRTSLIKFSSARLTLPRPIRRPDGECTLPCPLSSLSSPLRFQPPCLSISGLLQNPIALSLSPPSPFLFSVTTCLSAWCSLFTTVFSLWAFIHLDPSSLVFRSLFSPVLFLSLYLAISLFPVLHLSTPYLPSPPKLFLCFLFYFFHLFRLQPIFLPSAHLGPLSLLLSSCCLVL